MLVMLALATHVTVARADTPNTITQTAITSPSDPSYFYDSTGGAYGSVTVSGTTNSTAPATDQVDIDCYDDSGYDYGAVASDVSLDSSGDFSTSVDYADLEDYDVGGVCRLRAVPAGTAPTTDLASFAGPRVLVSGLEKEFDFYTGTAVTDWSLWAPQLGASDNFASLDGSEGACGPLNMYLQTDTFGVEAADPTFECSDAPTNYSGQLQVDGAAVTYPDESSDSISVMGSQDATSGDITIHETEPLDECTDTQTIDFGGGFTYTYCDAWASDGIDDDRTIQQANDGKVVLITDDFVSTDGQAHTVSFESGNHVDLGTDSSGSGLLWSFPGGDGFQPYSGSSSVDVSSVAPPATIYAYNENDPDGSTAEGRAAITYFTAPSDDITFPSDGSDPGDAQSPLIPFTVDVPAGGSQSVSIGYASEYSQSDFAADLQTEQDLLNPPTITIGAPANGATESSASVSVSGSVTATTGVKSVTVNGVSATVSGSSFTATVPLTTGSNTITATVTSTGGVTASATESLTYTAPTTVTPEVQASWAGPLWLPIANTGSAKAASAHKEKLSGRVTSGSGAVSYYFEYGTAGRLNHRSGTQQLAASKVSQAVALGVGGLKAGAKYTYRLIATGQYGHSAGASRTFKVVKRRHH